MGTCHLPSGELLAASAGPRGCAPGARALGLCSQCSAWKQRWGEANAGKDQLPILSFCYSYPAEDSRRASHSGRVLAGASQPRSLPGCRALVGTGWGQESQPLPCAAQVQTPFALGGAIRAAGRSGREEQEGEAGAAAAPLRSLGCGVWVQTGLTGTAVTHLPSLEVLQAGLDQEGITESQIPAQFGSERL